MTQKESCLTYDPKVVARGGQRKGQLLALGINFWAKLLASDPVSVTGGGDRGVSVLGVISSLFECRWSGIRWLFSNELSRKLINTVTLESYCRFEQRSSCSEGSPPHPCRRSCESDSLHVLPGLSRFLVRDLG